MKRDVVVFDLDGTLADLEHRLHLVKSEKPDWSLFFDLCYEDKVFEWCRDLMRVFDQSHLHPWIMIVSARPARLMAITSRWLDENDIPYDELNLIRPDGNTEPDEELKVRFVRANRMTERTLIWVDDRQKVVDALRTEGIRVLQCDAWPEYSRPKKRIAQEIKPTEANVF